MEYNSELKPAENIQNWSKIHTLSILNAWKNTDWSMYVSYRTGSCVVKEAATVSNTSKIQMVKKNV